MVPQRSHQTTGHDWDWLPLLWVFECFGRTQPPVRAACHSSVYHEPSTKNNRHVVLSEAWARATVPCGDGRASDATAPDCFPRVFRVRV